MECPFCETHSGNVLSRAPKTEVARDRSQRTARYAGSEGEGETERERERAVLSRLEKKKRLTVNTRIIRVLPNKVLRFRSPLFQTSYTLWHMSHMKTNDVVKQMAERIRRKADYLFTFGLFSPLLPSLSFSPSRTTRIPPPILLARTSRPTVVAVRLGRRFSHAGR